MMAKQVAMLNARIDIALHVAKTNRRILEISRILNAKQACWTDNKIERIFYDKTKTVDGYYEWSSVDRRDFERLGKKWLIDQHVEDMLTNR